MTVRCADRGRTACRPHRLPAAAEQRVIDRDGDWLPGRDQQCHHWARGAERLEVTANPQALGFTAPPVFTGCGGAETEVGAAPRMMLGIS